MDANIHEQKPYPDSHRFVNVTGRVRLRRIDGGHVLEQEFYANMNENGEHLQYHEIKWLPVPIVD